jgi:hypothetical protein
MQGLQLRTRETDNNDQPAATQTAAALANGAHLAQCVVESGIHQSSLQQRVSHRTQRLLLLLRLLGLLLLGRRRCRSRLLLLLLLGYSRCLLLQEASKQGTAGTGEWATG